MGHKFYGVWTALSQAMGSTPRSSSRVENLNSRLRNWLTLRRHLNGGKAWLGLLQFFFNHRRFMRSRPQNSRYSAYCKARSKPMTTSEQPRPARRFATRCSKS
jgi:hypothetical protein